MSKVDIERARERIGKVYSGGSAAYVADVLGLQYKPVQEWKGSYSFEEEYYYNYYGSEEQEKEEEKYVEGVVVGVGYPKVEHIMIFDGKKFLHCPGFGAAVKEEYGIPKTYFYHVRYS